MTEMIFSQEERDLKLTCTLHIDTFSVSARYIFKLMQRAKGKRKWQDIKGYEHTYRVNTDMDDILRYLSRSQVMGLAELEYKKYAPTESLFNV
jgi:hypothetical protein